MSITSTGCPRSAAHIALAIRGGIAGIVLASELAAVGQRLAGFHQVGFSSCRMSSPWSRSCGDRARRPSPRRWSCVGNILRNSLMRSSAPACRRRPPHGFGKVHICSPYLMPEFNVRSRVFHGHGPWRRDWPRPELGLGLRHLIISISSETDCRWVLIPDPGFRDPRKCPTCWRQRDVADIGRHHRSALVRGVQASSNPAASGRGDITRCVALATFCDRVSLALMQPGHAFAQHGEER